MKTFLIATDFSAASRNATQYGIELANAFTGRVILVNAYQQVPVTGDLHVVDNYQLQE